MARFFGSLFGKQATTPPATGLRVSTSVQGTAIPLILGGQTRMAVNLINYFDFYSVTNSSSSGGGKGGVTGGGGKGGQPGTSYYVSAIVAACEGAIAGVVNTFTNGSPGIGFSSTQSEVFYGDYSQLPWGYSEAIDPSQALSYRGIAYVGWANMDLGSSPSLPQINLEVLSNNNGFVPGQPDGDPSTALISFLTNQYWGLGFPAARIGQLQGTPFSWQNYCKSLGFGMSPAVASSIQASSYASDLITATNSAACWQNGLLNVVPYGDTAVAQGSIQEITETHIVPSLTYVIPPNPPAIVPTQTIIIGNVGTFVADRGVTYTGGSAFTLVAFPPLASGQYSQANGTYTFSYLDAGSSVDISYEYAAAASYIPNTEVLYDFTIDDFLPNQGTIGTGLGEQGNSPILCVRVPRDQMNNIIKLEYLDRNNLYNPVDIELRDSASITTFKRYRPSDTKQFHFFCLASAATQSAALLLVRAQMARMWQFTVGKHFTIILELMQIVTLTYSNMGLERLPVRIIEIQENSDQTLTVTCEDFPGTASAPVYGTEASVGMPLNYNVDPGPINTPLIFEPTDELGNALISGGGLMLAAAVSGTSPLIWGGAQVWLSYDGQHYSNVGDTPGQARMGVLSAQLGGWPVNNVGQSIDTLHTASVDLAESNATLSSGSQLDATSLNTRCFVGPLLGQAGAGAGEVIAYQNATLTSSNNYDLTYLVRGAYGTEDNIAVWPAGTGFARLDANIFTLPFDKSRIGATIFIKFLSFNLYKGGLQTLDNVPAYQYTLQGLALASPLPTITNLRTTFVNNRLAATWDEITDFRSGIRYEIRLGASFESALVLGTVAHPPYVLPGDGTYWFTGWVQPAANLIVRSEEPVSITVVGATLSGNLVASRDCKAANWSGTFNNALVDESVDAVRTAGQDTTASLVAAVTATASAPAAAGTSTIIISAGIAGLQIGMGVADLTDGGALSVGTTIVDITQPNPHVALSVLTLSLPIPFDWDPADFPPPDWGSRGVLAGDTLIFFNSTIVGTYTPDFTVNVGRPVPTTITIAITGSGIPIGQNILDEPNILAMQDVLGASSSQFVSIYPNVSVSQDGINYAAPIRYSPGDYFGQSFEFSFTLETMDLGTIAYLQSAVITVQVPVRIDHILTNGTLPSAGLAVTFTPDGSSTPAPFNGGPNNATVPQIIASWGDEQPGDVLSVTGLTDSGCTIQIKNGGLGVQRNQVSVYAEGY